MIPQFDYYNDLANIAGIENIKPVFCKMMNDSKKYISELEAFRNYCYTIVDDENYIKYAL